MGRYLMFIAYIGRGFRGLQRQPALPPGETIIGAIEETLKYLQPANKIDVVTSSRTDKGVNALCNTVHVDLQSRHGDTEFQPDEVTAAVNLNMCLLKHDIRVLRTLRVADDFHSRFNALSRTYVYRCAVTRQPDRNWALPHPPFEYTTTYLKHRDTVDIELLRRAAELLTGTHDFSAFSKGRVLKQQAWINPVKTLQVSVAEGVPFMQHHLPEVYRSSVHNLEFIFKGGSFLFRQVRKMVAVMLAVGDGQLRADAVTQMLERPRDHHVTTHIDYNIPSYGLYLTDVEYNPKDLIHRPAEGSSDIVRNQGRDTKSETGPAQPSESYHIENSVTS